MKTGTVTCERQAQGAPHPECKTCAYNSPGQFVEVVERVVHLHSPHLGPNPALPARWRSVGSGSPRVPSPSPLGPGGLLILLVACRVLAATLFAHDSAAFDVHVTAGLGDAGRGVSGAGR